MNRTKIEYCDYTWNPVTGCKHGCPYCYARRIGMRFQDHFNPTFHESRLGQPAKCPTPSTIFVCSMGDLFGGWVTDSWITKVLGVAEENPHHTFLFLTKAPDRYIPHYHWPENCWLGVSVDTRKRAIDILNLTKRAFPKWYADLGKTTPTKFWISCEPLLEDVASLLDLNGISAVIIGAQTGPGAIKPDEQWVVNIIHRCEEAGVKFFLKNNIDEGLREMYSEHKLNGLPWEVRG